LRVPIRHTVAMLAVQIENTSLFTKMVADKKRKYKHKQTSSIKTH